MKSIPFNSAADLDSAQPIDLGADNNERVTVINIQNTGTGPATVYARLKGASEYSRLEGECPAGVIKIIDGLRMVHSIKVVGANASGVLTA